MVGGGVGGFYRFEDVPENDLCSGLFGQCQREW